MSKTECQYATDAEATALPIIAHTRLSRSDANKEIADPCLAAFGRLGCAIGVAYALRRLELNMARHQDRSSRFAADFLCRDTIFDCDRCAGDRVDWTCSFAASPPQRLRITCYDRN